MLLNHSENQTFLGKFIEANNKKKVAKTRNSYIGRIFLYMLTTNYEKQQQQHCRYIQT